MRNPAFRPVSYQLSAIVVHIARNRFYGQHHRHCCSDHIPAYAHSAPHVPQRNLFAPSAPENK
jgi:hypothetical protein